MTNVTAIVVSYNTHALMRNCYNSIRKFYPTMPCVLVDGSDPKNDCYDFVRTRNKIYNKIFNLKKNIGHGPGMKLGIEHCETEYFLLIDSDVTINKAGIVEQMLSYFEQFDLYGVGQVMQVNEIGMNVEKGIPYLHPHFALISKSKYSAHDYIINHGAPMLRSMISLNERGGKLQNISFGNNITHHERGTRKLNPKEFHPKNWEKV